MTFGIEEILIGIGTFITVYIINNTKLREGITEWFINLIGKNNYNISDHNVKESIKTLKFEAKLTEFDNKIKTDLYHYYVNTVLIAMDDLVFEILEKEKTATFQSIKTHIKNNMYDKLAQINIDIDKNIKMPGKLQDKFDKFRNYLTKQHTHAIDNALQSPNKKLLLVQVLDAIENNSSWFLFYTTEMFENFNGHFDTLTRNDVFIKHKS